MNEGIELVLGILVAGLDGLASFDAFALGGVALGSKGFFGGLEDGDLLLEIIGRDLRHDDVDEG